MRFSKRLSSCLKYTQGYQKLADIGTDHALLPIHAIAEGFVSFALAIDNKEGPFVTAYNNVLKHKLQNRIKVILSEGLNSIDEDVDVVVISGMGGNVISNILLQDNLQNVKRLILQPNNDSFLVRESIVKIGFHIVDELVLNDNHKTYDIIVCDIGSANYTENELLFGPINLTQKPYYFVKRIEKEVSKLKKALPNITSESKIIEISSKIKQLEEVIK